MRVAVQGCSHGCLSAIYDSVAQYTQRTSNQVDLLLLCGDFQALRSEHDFASLAVPPKYYALGTFHQYYSGQRVAPLLTIVIGGNHEASNYMWELYHGGWLAPNIYYLGAAGSVLVNGLRIVGASGIYKDHDYRKGHFETVPYNNSTMRSVYHIRQYDLERLKLLGKRDHTIALSHDWPTTIPRHGDTKALLRRKPFFEQEVKTDTLGSPPLLELMREIQPEHWFSAHLHVKFAAVYEHAPGSSSKSKSTAVASKTIHQVPADAGNNPDEITIEDDEFDEDPSPHAVSAPAIGNPDEIDIGDEDFDDEPATSALPITTSRLSTNNPDEINIGDEDFDAEPEETIVYQPNGKSEVVKELEVDESADLVEQARKDGENEAAIGVIGVVAPVPSISALTVHQPTGASDERITKFLALDKCGPGKDFIQFLDIPSPVPVTPGQPPRMTYDPEWLAITRVLHPYLSLKVYQETLPPQAELERLINIERERIQSEGLLVPQWEGEELIWERGEIDVGRVQKFWPTAPAQGMPGGSSSAWYTNPQTEAFCGMLGVHNKINPAPLAPLPQPQQ